MHEVKVLLEARNCIQSIFSAAPVRARYTETSEGRLCEVVISGSVRGGTRVQKFRTPLVQIVNADLGGERCVLLCQPADQRHAASFCAAEEHNTADSVKVVEVGTRGRARRAQTATRCPTWVRGACWCSGSPAARWMACVGNTQFFCKFCLSTPHSVGLG